MKRLIIGASGFVGSHLSRRLIEAGEDVVLLDRRTPSYDIKRGVGVELGDYGDPDVIGRVLNGISVVYHLGCTTVPGTAQENPSRDIQENVLPTLRLLEACVRSRVRRVFFPSSGGTVYGVTQNLPSREDHPTNPVSAYGIMKLTIEHYMESYHQLYGLDGGIFRIGNLYGCGQDPGKNFGAVAVFMHNVINGLPVKIWGDGSAVRDYLHVHDLIDAMLLWEVRGAPNGTFNIGTGTGTSVNELIRRVENVTGLRAQRLYEEARPCDLPASILDSTLAARTFGWQAKTSLAAGIECLMREATKLRHP